MNFSIQIRDAAIISLVFVVVVNCFQSKFRRIENVISDVMDHLTVRNVLHCARSCAQQGICDGWKYNDETKECVLLEKITFEVEVFSNNSALTSDVNTYMVSGNGIYSYTVS